MHSACTCGCLWIKHNSVPMDSIYLQYSSWPGDIRSSYKAVMVDTINTLSGRSETVRVSNEYVPLPPDDRLVNISL